MIDAVSIASSQGVSRPAVQPVSYVQTPPPEPTGTFSAGVSHIRIDNTLNLAIIEYRSTQTGDVLRQYPTKAQIQAFSRAAELDARKAAEEAAAAQAQVDRPVEIAKGSDDASSTPEPQQAASGSDTTAVPATPVVAYTGTGQAVSAAPADTSGADTQQSITV